MGAETFFCVFMISIKDELLAMSDREYRDFSSKLMPSVEKDRVIGIRIPKLRQYAKQINNSCEALQFLDTLPHTYFEEDNLHAFLIEQIKDYDECIKRLNAFLPFVNNWATCDSLNPKCFKRNLPLLIEDTKRWITSRHTYVCRFGIGMLMRYFLEEETFKSEYLDLVASVKSEEYYIMMMQAWYFATALAKQYDSTLSILQDKRLNDWTHNKTIQKAKESLRISPLQKRELARLKV